MKKKEIPFFFVLVNILFIAGGLLLLFISIFVFEKSSFLYYFSISLSSSIIGANLVIFFVGGYFVEIGTIRNVLKNWGVVDIYSNKKDAVKSIDKVIKKSTHELDLIACYPDKILNSLIGYIKKNVGGDLRLRLIIPDESSVFVKQMEKELGYNSGRIKEMLKEMEGFIDKIKGKTDKSEFFQVKYFNELLLHYYVRMDNDLFFMPEYKGLIDDNAVIYQYEKPSLGYEYYKSYFEKIWVNDKFTKSKKIKYFIEHNSDDGVEK